MDIASIETKNYAEVIEIRVPVQFYFTQTGTFDGLGIGPFTQAFTPRQEEMMNRCLEAIGEAMKH